MDNTSYGWLHLASIGLMLMIPLSALIYSLMKANRELEKLRVENEVLRKIAAKHLDQNG